MAAEQKQSTLLEEIESHLRQLSPERLQVVAAFLAYLHRTEETQAKKELLSIPGFAASFREMQPEGQEEAYNLVMGVVQREMSKEELSAFLEKHLSNR